MQNKTGHKLSLFDSTCLIVGIIVGAGVYQFAPDIASSTSSQFVFFGLWIAGGILSLAGALCYAELATTYPQSGGDIVYLNKAYGKWAGFLFGWAQLVITRPGDIAAMTLVFATFASAMMGEPENIMLLKKLAALTGESERALLLKWLATAAVLVLTIINMIGIRQEKWTQNLLTVLKIFGLVFILVLAFFFHPSSPAVVENVKFEFSLRVALILVLFTYGGWMEIVYVASDVKEPQKNILKSILLGLSAVTLLYLLLNGAFLYTLGHAGMATSKAVPADTVAAIIPRYAANFIGALICISALGSANGLIFTGSRISEALGREYTLFNKLQSKQTEQNGEQPSPFLALLLQAAIAITLIFILGNAVEAIIFMAAIVYTFYMGTTLSVIVLRYKDPQQPRPYKVTGYPFTPLFFAAVCAYMIYGAIDYKPMISLAACGIVLLGLPIYYWSRTIEK